MPDPMEGLDAILIRGLEVFGHHGVLPEEKEHGQVFLIDADLRVDQRLGSQTDHLKDAVDYSLAVARIATIVREERFDLIESLAERIASELLGNSLVASVRILVRKPDVPLGEKVEWVGVEIERSR